MELIQQDHFASFPVAFFTLCIFFSSMLVSHCLSFFLIVFQPCIMMNIFLLLTRSKGRSKSPEAKMVCQLVRGEEGSNTCEKKISRLKWWDNMCEEKKNVHRDTRLEYNQKKRNTMTDKHRAEINAETKKRQRERRQSDLAGSIPSNPPTERDIVFGQRAARWKNHPGNLWITSVSIQRKQDYKSTRSRIDKDAILRNIISSTKSDRRRFVHVQNNNWFEASDDLARTYLQNKITDI